MLKTLPKITTPTFRPIDYLLGKQMKILWSDGICPPCQFDATVSQVVFHDNRVCVSISDPRQDTTAVWEYDLNCWKEHPCVIASQCSIIFLRERLAAVGDHYSAAWPIQNGGLLFLWWQSLRLFLRVLLPILIFLLQEGRIAKEQPIATMLKSLTLTVDVGKWFDRSP